MRFSKRVFWKTAPIRNALRVMGLLESKRVTRYGPFGNASRDHKWVRFPSTGTGITSARIDNPPSHLTLCGYGYA